MGEHSVAAGVVADLRAPACEQGKSIAVSRPSAAKQTGEANERIIRIFLQQRFRTGHVSS